MTQEQSNDSTLVAAMLAGDEATFRSFFDGYFPGVYRFALPRLGNDAEACKAMRGLAGFRDEAALSSWSSQICRQQIADHVRAAGSGESGLPRSAGDGFWFDRERCARRHETVSL